MNWRNLFQNVLSMISVQPLETKKHPAEYWYYNIEQAQCFCAMVIRDGETREVELQ